MRRALLAAAALAAACQSSSAPPGAGMPPAAPAVPQAAIRVEAQGRTDVFDTQTRELDITLAWPDGAGRRASLEVYAPGGSLYQRLAQPIAADGTARFSLPVAGTYISQYQLAGEWELRAFPAGESEPIAAAEFLVLAR